MDWNGLAVSTLPCFRWVSLPCLFPADNWQPVCLPGHEQPNDYQSMVRIATLRYKCQATDHQPGYSNGCLTGILPRASCICDMRHHPARCLGHCNLQFRAILALQLSQMPPWIRRVPPLQLPLTCRVSMDVPKCPSTQYQRQADAMEILGVS